MHPHARKGANSRAKIIRTFLTVRHAFPDHYQNPRNVGSLNKDDVNVGTGLVGAPACGDLMKLQIKVDDSKSRWMFNLLSLKHVG